LLLLPSPYYTSTLVPIDHFPNRVYLSHSHGFKPPFDSVRRIVPVPSLLFGLLAQAANGHKHPSKDGNLPFGGKRQKIHTDNEMGAEFDDAPFLSSGINTSMDPTSIVVSHDSAKLDPKLEHQFLYRLKVYQTYQVTRPNLLNYSPTQTSSPHSLFSDAVVPLVGILILTKAPSAPHVCSMAITQPDAQHQTRLGANFVLKITIPHSINVLIPTALIKQENPVTIFHPMLQL
jgi:hypothetical protein